MRICSENKKLKKARVFLMLLVTKGGYCGIADTAINYCCGRVRPNCHYWYK